MLQLARRRKDSALSCKPSLTDAFVLQCYSVCGMKKATCEARLEKCMKAKCALMSSASDREKCDSTIKLFQLGTQVG